MQCDCSFQPRVRVSLDIARNGILHLGWYCHDFLDLSAGFGKLSAASRALGKDLWSVSGKWKKQSAPNDQKKTNDVVLLQALTQVEANECTDFKGWDWQRIDGSPSLSKGQATGRVDVPVDAIATSFGYVGVALLHRSPQCVVLVNQGSHVEKKEKTVFCEGCGREDQGATCGGFYANLGTLGRKD